MAKISELRLACGGKVCEHEGPVWVLASEFDREPREHPEWRLSARQTGARIEVPGIGGGYPLRCVFGSKNSALATVRDRYAEVATKTHATINKAMARHTQSIEFTQHRDDATGDYVVRMKTAEGVWSIAAANGLAEAELIVEALRGVIRAYRGFDPCEEAFDRLWHYVNGNEIAGGGGGA